MTEQEWLECDDPQKMLRFLREEASDRRLRLFACACCRRIWDLLPDRRCRKAVEIAEKVAEGTANVRLLRAVEGAGERYSDHRDDMPEERMGYFAGGAIFQLGQERPAAHCVADATSRAVSCSTLDAGGDQFAANEAKNVEYAAQCHLLRDIFGNPFRSVAIPAEILSWNVGTIPRLAQAIYEDRDFDRLPILADALEEAGCTDSDILSHCRQPEGHVRGCWVLGLLLDKK